MAHRATFTQSIGRKSGRGCLHGARQEYVVHDALLSSIDEATSLEQMPGALKTQKTAPAGGDFSRTGLLADNDGLSSSEVVSP
jgi:hypothetical protein